MTLRIAKTSAALKRVTWQLNRLDEMHAHVLSQITTLAIVVEGGARTARGRAAAP